MQSKLSYSYYKLLTKKPGLCSKAAEQILKRIEQADDHQVIIDQARDIINNRLVSLKRFKERFEGLLEKYYSREPQIRMAHIFNKHNYSFSFSVDASQLTSIVRSQTFDPELILFKQHAGQVMRLLKSSTLNLELTFEFVNNLLVMQCWEMNNASLLDQFIKFYGKSRKQDQYLFMREVQEVQPSYQLRFVFKRELEEHLARYEFKQVICRRELSQQVSSIVSDWYQQLDKLKQNLLEKGEVSRLIFGGRSVKKEDKLQNLDAIRHFVSKYKENTSQKQFFDVLIKYKQNSYKPKTAVRIKQVPAFKTLFQTLQNSRLIGELRVLKQQVRKNQAVKQRFQSKRIQQDYESYEFKNSSSLLLLSQVEKQIYFQDVTFQEFMRVLESKPGISDDYSILPLSMLPNIKHKCLKEVRLQ